MADVVTSQTIQDGQRKAVMKFTNASDGSGESAVKKVDVSALNSNFSRRCLYFSCNCKGMVGNNRYGCQN